MKTQRSGKRFYGYLKTLVTVLAVALLLPMLAYGEELGLLVPAYEGDELAKLREWEKTWAGKKIDKTNVDQVRDYLFEEQIKVIKDPEYVNAKEYWFEIIPYQKAQYSKGQIEMTKKNAPLAKLNGDELVDYKNMAGFIFPQPKSGIEVAYNFDMQTKGDAREETTDGYVVEPRTGLVRQSERRRKEMFWSGRSYTQPYPNIPDNPKGFRRTLFTNTLSPKDFEGMNILEIKYDDTRTHDDEWIYMPNFRRIRRVSHAQRGDNIDGTELLLDDDGGWYDHIVRNNYKLLGRKELLLARHTDLKKLSWPKNSGIYLGITRERIKMYEVEAIYKEPHYTYSKQVWYIDPENWLILIKKTWDEDGKMWRLNENLYQAMKTVDGEEAYVPAGTMNLDTRGRHASINKVPETKNIGKNFPLSQFNLNALQQYNY
jgi:hypothetical protein